ncbi:hypothetical protein SDJN03_18796, partial [Cucurbita argyrosperma subsp. sororia]
MASTNNKRQKPKSPSCFFSIFSLFRSRDSRKRRDETIDDMRKVWPSDEDRDRYWVAEPGIDRKAKAYIDKIHTQIRSSGTE